MTSSEERAPEERAPRQLTSVSDLTRALSFTPAPFDKPHSSHRDFVKVYATFEAHLIFDRGNLTPGVMKISLELAPNGSVAASGRRGFEYNLLTRYKAQLEPFEHPDEGLSTKLLKKGGYETILRIYQELEASGELEGMAEWARFERKHPITFTQESIQSWNKILETLNSWKPLPAHSEAMFSTEVTDLVSMIRACGFVEVPCASQEEKWRCFVKQQWEMRTQIVLEQLVHSSGFRLFIRLLKEGEDESALVRDQYNIGRYAYGEFGEGQEDIDSTGRIVDAPTSQTLTRVGHVISGAIEGGWLETLQEAERFVARYGKDQLAFKKEVVDKGVLLSIPL